MLLKRLLFGVVYEMETEASILKPSLHLVYTQPPAFPLPRRIVYR
jgi:hypothetical protein